ncbi:hypothetical protein E2C01_074781 [Portunus trituberculatus]|uniref:Uncharacterized protein n=1 Tax=Portunus trituberculatus TaxID=210409 RepID=A0A5B7I6R0_PORTR|nr:hypothetical protein [Portunus trituberculatus]
MACGCGVRGHVTQGHLARAGARDTYTLPLARPTSYWHLDRPYHWASGPAAATRQSTPARHQRPSASHVSGRATHDTARGKEHRDTISY